MDELIPLQEAESSKFNQMGTRHGLEMLNKATVAIFLVLDNSTRSIAPEKPQASTVMDPNSTALGPKILKLLGVNAMRLHIKSERSLVGLSAYGLKIDDTVIMERSSPMRSSHGNKKTNPRETVSQL